MNEFFRRFSNYISERTGTPWAFLIAVVVVVLWAVTGPVFHFSDTWQLVINTGTTIVTFLMVFLIQNTQNRDNKAMHLKLDELLRAVEGARTTMVDLENCTDEELAHLQEAFHRLKRFATPAKPAVAHVADELIEDISEERADPSRRDARKGNGRKAA